MKFIGVSRHFGDRAIIQNLDLEVAGKTAILGPNGSGKTTLLRLAAGILHPTKGQIEAGNVAYVPQEAPVYPELTPRQLATWWAALHKCPPADLSAAGIPFPDKPSAILSRGQRQRLHLAMALATDATLVLDEPFAALDEAGHNWLLAALQNRAGQVLMSLHDEAIAEQLAADVVRL